MSFHVMVTLTVSWNLFPGKVFSSLLSDIKDVNLPLDELNPDINFYNDVLIYVLYQDGVIQGHPDHMCPTKEALSLCSGIAFQAVLHQI